MPKKRRPPDLDDDILECVPRLLRDFKRCERPDVSARKVGNRETEFTIVKSTWNSFCLAAGKALTPVVESAMTQLDKTVHEAYNLANLHVSRLCQSGRTPELPKLGQEFFYACLSAVSRSDQQKGAIKDPALRESLQVYDTWRPDGIEKPDSNHLSSGFHQNLSLQMATNAKNAVVLNFYNRFKRYLKHKYLLDGRSAYDKLQILLSKGAYTGDDPVIMAYLPMARLVKLPSRPDTALPLLYKFARYAEIENAKLEQRIVDRALDSRAKLVRLFSLLPHKKGFGSSHIKICQNGLFGLLKRGGSQVTEKQYKADVDLWWRKLFDVKRFETRTRKFAGEVLTDGVGASIVLRRPKSKISTTKRQTQQKADKDRQHEAFDLQKYGQVWGLDPGRKDLFVASDEEDQVVKCSTKEFYHCAKYKESVKKNRRWTDRDPEVRDAILRKPTNKTVNLGTMERNVRYVLPRLDMLTEFYSRRRVRHMKFKRFRFCQKKLNDVCRSLTAAHGRKTIVGFGDWSNQDGGVIKKCQSGPVKRLEAELKRYCRVVPVDEFRTSKLCNCCHCELQNARRKIVGKDFKRRVTKVHAVLHCQNSECRNMSMNRDVNASRNMRDLLMSTVRPWGFSRMNKNQNLVVGTSQWGVRPRLSIGRRREGSKRSCATESSTLQRPVIAQM